MNKRPVVRGSWPARQWLPAALAATIGIGLGLAIGYYTSLGGIAAMGAILPVMGLGVLLLLLAIIGAIGALSRGRRGLVEFSFVSASLLLLGTALGMASGPALGLVDRAPATLESSGTITLTLSDVAGFATMADSPATCTSLEGSEALSGVSGLELGELAEGTLRGGFAREAETALGAAEGVMVDLFVDGGDLPDGRRQPFWHGPAVVTALDEDGRGGAIAFSSISLHGDAVGDPLPADGWPEFLSGELQWRCDDWRPMAGDQ
jgi:hypothetical protein